MITAIEIERKQLYTKSEIMEVLAKFLKELYSRHKIDKGILKT